MAFTCNDCAATFSEKTNLTRHIKSKHKNTNFKCKKCEFTTTRKDNLKTHIESKHYQNKVKCPECSAEFSRPDSMQRHKKEYHPKDPLALTPDLDWAEEVEREENQANQEKKKAQEEEATEKTAFKKRLVEIKWFISGEKDILAAGMEEEL